MKPIPVESEAEFERLLDHIAFETFRAHDHWSVLSGLDAAMAEYETEMIQSQGFWAYTMNAHRDTVLFHLTRLYDQRAGALSLGSFLMTVKAQSSYFTQECFRRRLAGNPYVEGLVTSVRSIDETQLQQEVDEVSKSDPLVSPLVALRNRYISHRDAHLVRLAALSSLDGLTVESVDALLNRAINIVNKYSRLYRASSYGSKTVGADDYKNLFRLLKMGFTKLMAGHRSEINGSPNLSP